MKIKLTILFTVVMTIASDFGAVAQQVPAKEENIPFLVTFSKGASKSFGDDDYCQVFFFSVSPENNKPVYIRVFDPNIGGKHDEIVGAEDSKTTFSLYGGKGCVTDDDARKTEPTGNYKSGNLLATKTFNSDPKYDDSWYTFGPFSPAEGEFSKTYGGNIFKLVANGSTGNDGNLYRYFLSSSRSANVPIEGGNAFTFEYTFRLHDSPFQVSHIYPYVDDKVISIKQKNFDWDNDGKIKLISRDNPEHLLTVSGDNARAASEYRIRSEKEKNSSFEIKFIKNPSKPARNNNVVISITNQYGEFLPFFSIPIGGAPLVSGNGKATPQKK